MVEAMLKNIGPYGDRHMLGRCVGHLRMASDAFAQVGADVGRGNVERKGRIDQQVACRRGLEHAGAGLPRGDYLRDVRWRRAEVEPGRVDTQMCA